MTNGNSQKKHIYTSTKRKFLNNDDIVVAVRGPTSTRPDDARRKASPPPPPPPACLFLPPKRDSKASVRTSRESDGGRRHLPEPAHDPRQTPAAPASPAPPPDPPSAPAPSVTPLPDASGRCLPVRAGGRPAPTTAGRGCGAPDPE